MSRATRQVVPAFLQKLYEMVNDPRNSDLIRWSDAGDTFFVLDHERFAHDVLGRWFKHRNFSSFVRQLNMYGFHKIPHLQQGVLKSDNETEFWNFAHPNFHRGQPDLLCLIQRKKTSNQGNADDIEIPDVSPTATTSGTGQVLDVHSIVNGITAIKRHQTTISTELNELKRSNQLLWQDAMAARQRHQKQQDTINRIVKFLAGVFGNNVNRPKDDSNDPGGVVSRRNTRFMIEDAKREGKSIVELDDMDTVEDVATPQSTASMDDSTTTLVRPPKVVEVVTPPAEPTPQLNPDPQAGDRALTPRLPPSSPVFDYNQQVQGMLGNLSQAQMQQLLSSLALQPNAEANSSNGSNANASTQNSHLTPYTPTIPPFDFSMIPPNVGPSNDNDNNQSLFSAASLQVPSDGLISFNSCDPFPHDRVERQWNQAEDIERDVSALSTSIQNLIDTYGLDPNLLDNPPPSSGPTAQPLPLFPSTSPFDSTQLPEGLAPLSASEFDFDAFLNNLNAPSGDMDFTDAASTAFLDEVPSPAPSTSSPAQTLRPMSPEVTTNAAGLSSGNILAVSIPGSTSFGVGGSVSTPPNTTIPLSPPGDGSDTGTGLGKKRKSDESDLDGATRTQFQTVTPASILVDTSAPSNASTIPANSGAAAASKTKRRKER